MSDIIYILINPYMPRLAKVGKTQDLEARVKQLSGNTGVPVPFEVHYACRVEDATKVETHVHRAFEDHRVNSKREFFEIAPERLVHILKLVELEDVTPSNDMVEDEMEQEALNKARSSSSRRENFTFSNVGISPNAVLTFTRDDSITVTVVDDRNVNYKDAVMSITKAAVCAFKDGLSQDKSTLRGPDYWRFESETLTERRDRIEMERYLDFQDPEELAASKAVLREERGYD